MRGAIEPHEDVITLLDTGGKASDVVASAVPGLSGEQTESSGRGVGGTELFGAVVADQVLRVGEAAIPLPRLVVIGDVEGRGILVGMDVLRGTIVTVSGDPALPVFWQVPLALAAPNVHARRPHVFDVRLHAGPSRHGPQEHSLRGPQGRR